MRMYFVLICVLLGIVLASGCGEKSSADNVIVKGKKGEDNCCPEDGSASTDDSGVLEGTVTFTKDAGGYTYVELEKDGEKVWAAGPKTIVKVGDTVKTNPGAFMKNFKSKSLDRVFEAILFTNGLIVNGKGTASHTKKSLNTQNRTPDMKSPHGNAGMKNKLSVSTVKAGSIKIAEGGYTVEQIYKQGKALKGKAVTVRGKIVKKSDLIMDRYWYHLQDGTGSAPRNDLVITSKDGKTAVGAIVVAKGVLTADKNLGAGYKYEVLLENADFISE